MTDGPPTWASRPGGQQPASPSAGAVDPGPRPVGSRALAVVWNSATNSWEPAAPLPLSGFAPAGTWPTSWGVVSAAGAILAGSGDYTISKGSTGRYVIHWTVAKAAPYALVVMAREEGITCSQITAVELTEATVIIETLAAAPANSPWSFIVVAAS